MNIHWNQIRGRERRGRDQLYCRSILIALNQVTPLLVAKGCKSPRVQKGQGLGEVENLHQIDKHDLFTLYHRAEGRQQHSHVLYQASVKLGD